MFLKYRMLQSVLALIDYKEELKLQLDYISVQAFSVTKYICSLLI